MIEDINKILRETSFPNKKCNPFLMLCILCSVLSLCLTVNSTVVIMGVGLFPPYFIYFGLMLFMKSERKNRLLTFVSEWNVMKSNGLYLSFGGDYLSFGGVAVRSETGGTYDNFYMATRDPKSLMVRGYLHVFVNYQERANWCQQNDVPFIPPVPTHQQTMERQIAEPDQVPAPPAGLQVPAGYVLVPQHQQPPPVPHHQQPPPEFQVLASFGPVLQHEQPPQEFQIPQGYALVPQHEIVPQQPPEFQVPPVEDLPPNYDEAIKMPDYKYLGMV